MKNREGGGFRADPRLMPRIRTLCKENKGLDAEEIAVRLRQTYPEYTRRKLRDFIKTVVIGMKRLKLNEGIVDTTLTEEYESLRTEKKNNSVTKRSGSVPSSQNDLICKDIDKSSFSVIERKRSRKTTNMFPRFIDVQPETSGARYSNLGGCEKQFLVACRLCLHLLHPEVYEKTKATPPTGLILHGPSGCGKTLFARAVAGELGLPLLRLAATELVSGVSGESEQRIRALFERAVEFSPCILLIDEIDAVASKRAEAQREMERRIVSQLISCLDELSTNGIAEKVVVNVDVDDGDLLNIRDTKQPRVLVIGTTSRIESLDPALRGAGRFDKEILLGIPDKRTRKKILQIVCREVPLSSDVSFDELALLTPGYVGADLKALVREAATLAVTRLFEAEINSSTNDRGWQQPEYALANVEHDLKKMLLWLKSDSRVSETVLGDIRVNKSDFERALACVDPSGLREGFTTVPDVTWDDIGAMTKIREEIQWALLNPIRAPEMYEAIAMEPKPQGILLCGPPGCGKTLLAKAVANEGGVNFISVKGPELLNKYVGASEEAVRKVFQMARSSAPCVIFFDEIDALCPRRSNDETTGSARLVNQLLTEMDGIVSRKGVTLIGATNRPDIIDPAILRSGRLNKKFFIDFPDASERADILDKITKHGRSPRIDSDVSFEDIAKNPLLNWFTGADLAALVYEAGILALKEGAERGDMIKALNTEHFLKAAQQLRPSVSEIDRQKMRKSFSSL